MFSGENPKVSHLKICGCIIYLHVPKEKRSKLDPSRKKGIFVGYSDHSKDYKIYIPGFHHIEINRDVTFDEDAYFSKSKKAHADKVHEEEQEDPIIAETKDVKEEPIPKDHDMEEPQIPMETPYEMI